MSEKKRRDITLGEMQDECKGHVFCSECKYCAVCTYDRQVSINEIDLTDPPRFNEAQMAFWRGWHAMGAKFVRRWQDGNIWFVNDQGDDVGTIKSSFDLVDILEIGETLDLAELLGKDKE